MRGPMFNYHIPKRWYHQPIIIAMLIVLFYTTSSLISIIFLEHLTLSEPYKMLLCYLVIPSTVELSFIFYLRCYGDGLPLYTLGLRIRRPVHHYIIGLISGVISVMFVVSMSSLLGGAQITYNEELNSKMVYSILLMLGGFIIQGASEEITIRGYMLQVIGTKKGCSVAIICTATFFLILHSSNPSTSFMSYLNVFIFGCFSALMVIAKGEVITICGFHTAWNWSQAHLFGGPVSGNSFLGGSVFLYNGTEGKDLITGGLFGIEGSILTSVVFLAGALIYMRQIIKNGYNCTTIE